MNRRLTDAASAKSQIERRRIEQDEAILAWLRSHGQAVQSTEIARATRISWTGVVGRLGALVRIGAVRRSEIGKDRAGKKVITFQAISNDAPAARRTEAPFRPLNAPRATVIPVRSQGRIANTPFNDAPVSMGRPEFREIAS